MERILDALFGRRSGQSSRLKKLLGLTVCRVGILQRQRHVRWCRTRSDLIQLLLLGQPDRAALRAEMLIKEQDMIDAYALVESYCVLLMERALLLEQQEECPEELREAAAGLSFAASRCGDLPELQDVRRVVSSLFGKEFTAGAVELRDNCGVDIKMVKMLSARQPSLESRLKVIKEIAMERGIKLAVATDLSEIPKVDESPRWSKTRAEGTVMVQPEAFKTNKMHQDEYKSIENAAQAAFEYAEYAAVAAKAAVELFRMESSK